MNGNTEGLATALANVREAKAGLIEQRGELTSQVAELDDEIRRLERAERALDPQPAADKPAKSAIEQTEELMRELKTATQTQIAKALGRPKNTAKHALEQLTERGIVRPTGNIVSRSPEFELVELA